MSISQYNDECDESALFWAQQSSSACNALYRDLRAGDAFKFKRDGEQCIKESGRWYRASDGRRYVTGARVGVIR